MVTNKIYKVDDSVCVGCSQRWEGECRAFSMHHSSEELISRLSKPTKPKCLPARWPDDHPSYAPRANTPPEK